MVSILPAEPSPWQALGKSLSELGRNTPQLLENRYQRQQGLSAIDQLQEALQSAGGDINKMLPALAKAYTLNPGLERSGLGQTYLQQAKLNRAFPENGRQEPITNIPQNQTGSSPVQQVQPKIQPSQDYVKPSPFSIFTPQDIDQESERYARSVQDPAAYQLRQNELNNLNQIATQQRQDLEDAALKAGVKPQELPRFMQVGAQFDPRDVSKWSHETLREYNKVKDNETKMLRAFTPGLGSALFGRDRPTALKRLEPTVKDLVSKGLEQDVRTMLADEYLSPTEIEELIRPLTTQKEKALNTLPKGLFPARKLKTWEDIYKGNIGNSGLISYEEALEKAPKELEIMKNQLADFFVKNVDDDTSLLVLRDALWDKKDYDWRQIGPAIREAEKRGLKLNTRQSTELADVETQPPIQSLPDIFQDLDRVIQHFRGNK